MHRTEIVNWTTNLKFFLSLQIYSLLFSTRIECALANSFDVSHDTSLVAFIEQFSTGRNETQWKINQTSTAFMYPSVIYVKFAYSKNPSAMSVRFTWGKYFVIFFASSLGSLVFCYVLTSSSIVEAIVTNKQAIVERIWVSFLLLFASLSRGLFI